MREFKQVESSSILHMWKAEYTFVAIAVSLALVYAWGQIDLNLFADVISPFEAFAAFGMATLVLISHRGEEGGSIRRAIAWYSLGLMLWFVAESLWTLCTRVLGIPPSFPSIADIFWLGGYGPLLVGMLLQVWPFRKEFVSSRLLMVIVGTCVLASAVLVVAIPPMFQGPSDLLTLLVSIAYPILDMALLSVAVPVFFFFRRGTYWRPMLYVLVGITLQLIGDVVFIITLVGNWNPQDLIFDWSYLMLALGFYKWLKPVITS